MGSIVGGRALLVTWGSGGNLPPLLAAADLLAARGFTVDVLTSTATRGAARRRTIQTSTAGPRSRTRAHRSRPGGAGPRPGGRYRAGARRIRARSGLRPARNRLHAAGGPRRDRGGSWTTDRATLDATRGELGLLETAGDLEAWESPELLLVTLPRWFDAPGELPHHVVHAGPLGVRTEPEAGQPALVSNVCAALERAGIAGVLTLGSVLDRSVAAASAGVEVVDWADHDALMRGCDLVITHGGLGTTLRALAHGRRLLVLPLGRDQHFNAARVEALQAGLALPAGSPSITIADAIARLRAEPAFEAGARRAAEAIARERPDETAAEALARLA